MKIIWNILVLINLEDMMNVVFTNLSKNYNFEFNLYEDEINKIINEKMSWKNNENIKKSLVEYYYNNNQYVL